MTPDHRSGPPLLELRGVGQDFRVQGGRGNKGVFSAVSDVSLSVHQGETLGLVGESGCGKSTVARSIVQAPRPTRGAVLLRGVELSALRGAHLRRARRDIQMVFQDPFASLDPRWPVRNLIAEPLRINGIGTEADRRDRADQLMELVGLHPSEYAQRRPRELSGGQAQRVAIARALALSPALVICDEAVSSLDVSIQAQVLNLLLRLKKELDVAYLFIAHDLAVVRHLSDRVAVMYKGSVCELGPSDEVYGRPAHPYTVSLLEAGTDASPVAPTEEAAVPLAAGRGCPYRGSCPAAQPRCAVETPELHEVSPRWQVACHFPFQVDRRSTAAQGPLAGGAGSPASIPLPAARTAGEDSQPDAVGERGVPMDHQARK